MRIGRWKFLEHRTIGAEDGSGPLLERYVIIRHPKLFGVFVHKLCRSDHDRALHDHPWGFISLVLKSGYREEHFTHYRKTWAGEWPETVYRRNKPGMFLFRPATWRHRVIIDGKPAWTLVFVGPRRRRWGFWIPQWDGQTTWCWWAKYNPFKGICSDELLYDTDGDE
jgi:hypothetical protein